MIPGPRFVPMVGDSMEPTLRHGDLAAVLPVDDYRGEGLYVLDSGCGPEIERVWIETFRHGQLVVRCDIQAYQSGPPLPREWMASHVLAKVFAIRRITDRALIDDAGLLTSWGRQTGHDNVGSAFGQNGARRINDIARQPPQPALEALGITPDPYPSPRPPCAPPIDRDAAE